MRMVSFVSLRGQRFSFAPRTIHSYVEAAMVHYNGLALMVTMLAVLITSVVSFMAGRHSRKA